MQIDEYFKRQIELVGEDKQSSLQNKSIAVVGCGGLGCSLVASLGSSGIGKIVLIDFDTVSLSNIHRQIIFTLNDINKNKCEVLKEYIKSRNPLCKIEVKKVDFSSINELEVDLILDATDNFKTREHINKLSKESNTPWIYASVEEFNAQICFFHKSDFSVFDIKDKKVGGVFAPMVMQSASFSANMAIRYLLDMPIKKDKLYYLNYSSDGEFSIKGFNLPK
jgi:adenylyltransferase/sulfurtransferase